MLVFFHICLHQVSHLHRVDLSAFAVADLQGIRKGTWSTTAAQTSAREALSCPGEPVPAQTPRLIAGYIRQKTNTRAVLPLSISGMAIVYLQSTNWRQRHLKAKRLIFTTGFSTHPSSFTQHVVTKEVLISQFWDVFEEALFRLKECQFWENILRQGRKNRPYTSYFISLQGGVHNDFSSNWHCSALSQTYGSHRRCEMTAITLGIFIYDGISQWQQECRAGRNYSSLKYQLTALTTDCIFCSHDLLSTKIWDKN